MVRIVNVVACTVCVSRAVHWGELGLNNRPYASGQGQDWAETKSRLVAGWPSWPT